MTKYLPAALIALSSAPALATPMLYGFNAAANCFGLAACDAPREVTALFSVDPTLDLDPRPDFGRYAGTGMWLTLDNVVLPTVATFDVFLANNEPGPFCGFSAAQPQGRDRISILGFTGTSFVSAMLDTCNMDGGALESGSLATANLGKFGPFSTGPGEPLVITGRELLPHLFFPEALGTTRSIYALPPSAGAVPEPGGLLLLGTALAIAGLGYRRHRGI